VDEHTVPTHEGPVPGGPAFALVTEIARSVRSALDALVISRLRADRAGNVAAPRGHGPIDRARGSRCPRVVPSGQAGVIGKPERRSCPTQVPYVALMLTDLPPLSP